MKKPNYTPAPWAARVWAQDEETIKDILKVGMKPQRMLMNDGAMPVMPTNGDESSGRICLVDCHTSYKRGQGYLTECAERDANAKLIAQAPTLAEALHDLVEEYCDYMRINNLGDPMQQHNIKRAVAALTAAGFEP